MGTCRGDVQGNHGACIQHQISSGDDAWRALYEAVLENSTGVSFDLAWLSPPCTEFSWAKGARPKRHDVVLTALTALTAGVAPMAIVMENSVNITKDATWEKLQAVAFESGYSWLSLQIEAADYGATSRRKRMYVVMFRGDIDASAFELTPPHAVMRKNNVDRILLRPITRQANPTGVHLDRIKAFRLANPGVTGVYSCYGNGAANKINESLPTITTAARHMLILPSRGLRMMDAADAALAMDVPASYKIAGSARERHKMIGNGVSPLVAEALGLAVRRVLWQQGGAK